MDPVSPWLVQSFTLWALLKPLLVGPVWEVPLWWLIGVLQNFLRGIASGPNTAPLILSFIPPLYTSLKPQLLRIDSLTDVCTVCIFYITLCLIVGITGAPGHAQLLHGSWGFELSSFHFHSKYCVISLSSSY